MISIQEPVTFLTDMILAMECFYFGHILFWKTPNRYWGFAFLFLGFGSLFGGIYHGLIDFEILYPHFRLIWIYAIFSIFLGSYFVLLSIISEFFPYFKRTLYTLAFLKLLFMILFVSGTLSYWMAPTSVYAFKYVIYDYSTVLILLLLFHLFRYLKYKIPASGLIVLGVLFVFTGGVIQMLKIAPHTHFNHNDLYHVFQMVALYLIFKGIQKNKPFKNKRIKLPKNSHL